MTNFKRIILAQFGVTAPLSFVTPYRGLVWFRTTSITQDIVDTSFWTQNFGAFFDDTQLEPLVINTVSWNGRQLSEIDNLEDLFLESVVNSFFMDIPNQKIYIKNFDYLPPWQTPTLVSGVVTGASTMSDVDENGRPFNAAFGGLDYDERLLEESISQDFRLDNWTLNRMQFESFSFQLENPDGRFDDVRDDVMNQTAKLLMAEVPADKVVEIEDFEIIAKGTIRDISFPSEFVVTLSAEDIRGSWGDTVPRLYYEAGFLGLPADSGFVGKNYPVVFGEVKKAPAYRLNEGARTFHVSWARPENPLTSIDEVYSYNEGVYTPVNISSIDLDNGTFVLQNSFSDNIAYVDMIGLVARSISSTDTVGGTALDVAASVLNVWADLPFIDSYFNTSHIREVRDARPYQIGLAIPIGGAKISTIIESCTFSINTVYYTDSDVLDIAEMTVPAVPTATAYVDDLINSPPIVWDKVNYMSRIHTEYDFNWHLKVGITIVDDQFEASAQSRYLITKQFNFTTALVEPADAAAMGFERYDWSVLIRPRITLQFGGPIEFDFLDVVAFDYIQYGRQRLQPALYRVTGISNIRNEVTLTFIESLAVVLMPNRLRSSTA